MASSGRSESMHTRDTATALKAAVPPLDEEPDEASISRGVLEAARLLRGLSRGPRIRELEHRLDGYRRVLARWSAAGPQPTRAQRSAMLECVLELLADIFAASR